MPNDERTPDVIDGARFLGLSRQDGMRELGISSEQAYARVYRDVEAAVSTRDNRESQSGVHASIVIKRAGAPVVDATDA
jgi:hypothetical protein